jgi:Tfp pilus assembly PilM family ATPase
VRQALAKSGFQAQATALAVPETELQRFSLTLDAGLNARQMHQAIAAQLNSLLTLPLIDAVWDFEISVHNATASPLPGNQPAWLQAAMQTQSTLSADVLVITRAWVNTCEQWCRAAGLQLVRLEPPWQASTRWQLFSQQHNSPAAETLTDVLSIQQQAVLGGLALGAVTP